MRQSAIEKKERNSDRPMSEASIEARAVLSVLDELESIIAPARVTPCTCGFVDGAMWTIERQADKDKIIANLQMGLANLRQAGYGIVAERDEAKAEVERLKRVEDCSNARKAEILRLRKIIDEQAAELEKLKQI